MSYTVKPSGIKPVVQRGPGVRATVMARAILNHYVQSSILGDALDKHFHGDPSAAYKLHRDGVPLGNPRPI